MASAAVDRLLRTLAAVAPGQRILLRGPEDARVARPLSRMGFEVHAATWTESAARSVQEAVEAPEAVETQEPSRSSGGASRAPVYATAAPAQALPYPEGHFGWVVTRVPRPAEASEGELVELLEAVLEEARHHLRPGGWVFILMPKGKAPLTSETLDATAVEVGLAEAEAPASAGAQVHAIYRRVEDDTPP